MRKLDFLAVLIAPFLLLSGMAAHATEIDVLLTKLVEKNVLTPAEAQIIADETKVQISKDLSQGKSISVPEWTQRIKWGGDVRFRTQGDWGPGINEQRIRERVRGRFWMEGKANDFTYAGVRFAGGGDSRNSTNDTLGATTSLSGSAENYFRKAPVMFDQYYIRFEAPSEMVRSYGQYFSDLKLWAGRFAIPYNYSELVWDSDINPSGLAIQYKSPDIKTGVAPDMNVYSNIGMFWLDESATMNTDPLLFGWQVGVKTDAFGPMDTVLDISTTLYDFANMQDKTPNGSGTNSRWQAGELKGTSANSTLLGKTRYEYNVFDLLVNIDNSKVGDMEFPHGFYADFIYNAACHEDDGNKGALVGGYIGKKKIKNPGDWKARAEWRFIERDAIPDFMPDSDFYGFGTYAAGNNQNTNGMPVEGGTNGKGINMALEYQLFKNTALNIEYYWMKPIKSWDKTEPWNELQLDVITKF